MGRKAKIGPLGFTLAQLETLDSLAQTHNFRGTAKALKISQPAVSARLTQLESQVGVALVNRSTRSVSLTVYGEQLVIAARRALGELEIAAAGMFEESTLRRGSVTVAALPTISASWMVRIFASFRSLNPAIRLRLVDLNDTACVQSVLSGEADFAVATDWASANARLRASLLMREEIVAVTPVGHPLTRRDTVSIAEISRYDSVITVKGSSLRATVETAFRKAKRALSPAWEVDNMYTLLSFAQQGLGVTFLPTSSLEMLRLAGAHTISIKPALYRNISALTPVDKQMSPAALAVLAHVERAMKMRTVSKSV